MPRAAIEYKWSGRRNDGTERRTQSDQQKKNQMKQHTAKANITLNAVKNDRPFCNILFCVFHSFWLPLLPAECVRVCCWVCSCLSNVVHGLHWPWKNFHSIRHIPAARYSCVISFNICALFRLLFWFGINTSNHGIFWFFVPKGIWTQIIRAHA